MPLLQGRVGAIGKIGGRPKREDRDDLMAEAQMALWKSLPRFKGLGRLAAFARAVVDNALIDYVRRETKIPPSVALGDGLEDVGDDPTEAWCEWIDLRMHLLATENADLVLLHEFGYLDRELGENGAVICVRRNRAEKKLSEMY